MHITRDPGAAGQEQQEQQGSRAQGSRTSTGATAEASTNGWSITSQASGCSSISITSQQVASGPLLASVPLLVLPEPCCAEVLRLAVNLAGQSSPAAQHQLQAFITDLGILLELQQHDSPAAKAAAAWQGSGDADNAAVVAMLRRQVESLLLACSMTHCCMLLGVNPSSHGAAPSTSRRSGTTAIAAVATKEAEQHSTAAQQQMQQGPAKSCSDSHSCSAGPAEQQQQHAEPRQAVILSSIFRGFQDPDQEAAYRDYHALAQTESDTIAAFVTTSVLMVAYLRCWQEGSVHHVFYWGVALYSLGFTTPFWALFVCGPVWRARYRATWLLCSQLFTYYFLHLTWTSWVPKPAWFVRLYESPAMVVFNGAVFTSLVVQLPFRQALFMHLVHSIAVDLVAITAVHGWAMGVVVMVVMAVFSGCVSALLDWRCRIRFLGQSKVGKA